MTSEVLVMAPFFASATLAKYAAARCDVSSALSIERGEK